MKSLIKLFFKFKFSFYDLLAIWLVICLVNAFSLIYCLTLLPLLYISHIVEKKLSE